jgi:hypothetical protein
MTLRIAGIETFLYRAEVKTPVKTSFGSIPFARNTARLARRGLVPGGEAGHRN